MSNLFWPFWPPWPTSREGQKRFHALAGLPLYPVYTDSQACKFIGDNATKLGRIRHLDARTHVARCHISLGEVELIWCCTEEELAGTFTKVASSTGASLLQRLL